MRTLFSIIVLLPFLTIAANQTIINLSANTWYQVQNTHLYDVRPSGWGANVMVAWSGGAFDTKRDWLYIFGGGHNDYNGNELYAFSVDSLKWMRLTNPTANINYCRAMNSDGTPNSRHTYSGLTYIAHADRFFADGGCPACPEGGCGLKGTFTFDPAQKTWTNRNPSGSHPATNCENACAYDPVTRKVYFKDDSYISPGSGLFAYDYDSNSWTKLSGESGWGQTAALDTKRRLLFFVGRGNVGVYDVGNNNFTRQTWATTGGSSIVSSAAPGLDYDPVSDRIVGFRGGSVYALNPDTRVWTAYAASGAPSSTASGGVYGRWRYVPDCNAFIFVNAVQENVFFYKLTAGGGNSPVTKPAVASNIAKKGPARVFDITGREVTRGWKAHTLRAGVYFIKRPGQKAHSMAIVK